MAFERDETGNRTGFATHGIDFGTAKRIFGAAGVPQGKAILA